MDKNSTFLDIAQAAIAQYDLIVGQIEPIGHNDCATFLATTDKEREKYLLRVHVPISLANKSDRQSRGEIESELLWLEAIHDDTDICVQAFIAAAGRCDLSESYHMCIASMVSVSPLN